MDDRAVYFHVVDSEVNSCWDVKDVSSFVIWPQYHDEAHYTLRRTQPEFFIIFWLVYNEKMLDGELIHEKCIEKKFVMAWTRWRI